MKTNYDEKLLNLLVSNGGIIQFENELFSRSWNLSKIVAKSFTEQYDGNLDDDINCEKWNKYINKMYSVIGAKYYCTFVRNNEQEMCGILCFYNKDGEETKFKHFNKWRELYKIVENKLR